MRLLIITQKIDKDDSYFGFFHDWILVFAKICKQVTIITLEERQHAFPENVTVYSMGKEKRQSRIQYLMRFYSCIFQYRNQYDAVFAHMSPWYVICGFPIWKLLSKKIALWYVHRNVDMKLRLANWLTDIVFTATPESFGIPSAKVVYMGQAVDIAKFQRPKGISPQSLPQNGLSIVTVGRITPIKNIDTLIAAARILKDKGIAVQVSIIGQPVQEKDHEYARMLKDMVLQNDMSNEILFLGPVANKDIAEIYWKHAVSINLSPTGGLDKTVLESMASLTPVLVTNRAFNSYYEGYEEAFIKERDAFDCARALQWFWGMKDIEQKKFAEHLAGKVRELSSLDVLIQKIITNMYGKAHDNISAYKVGKKVCFFGIYNPEYSRNRILMRGFRENGWQVSMCIVDPKQYRAIGKVLALLREFKKLKDTHFDIVIVGFPGQNFVWLARILFKRNIILDAFLSFFDSNVYDRGAYHRYDPRAIRDWISDYLGPRFATLTLLDTKAHAEFFVNTFKVPREDIIVVPVGADETIFIPEPYNNVSPKPFTVYFHGSYIPLQGVSYIVDAAYLLRDENIHFILLGDGQTFHATQEKIQRLGLKNIELKSRVPYQKLPHEIAGADICLGCFGDTAKVDRVIPNKVYEYLAMAKPIITARTPAIQEQCRHKEHLFLCEKANAESLSEAILTLREDAKLRQSIAKRGYELFHANFEAEKIVADLLINLQKRILL